MGLKPFPPQFPPLLSVLALVLFVLGLKRFAAPSPEDGHGWFIFHFLLVAFAAVVGLSIYGYFFPRICKCNLYYTEEEEIDHRGLPRIKEVFCRKPAFGKVPVEGSMVSDRYFCEEHDPENEWMKLWLKAKGIKILPSCVTRYK